MSSIDDSDSESLTEGGWGRYYIRKHLNFYRIHLMYFTFTPLIFSGIFYASNGQYPVAYIDALYLCVSHMGVCGLASVNLSQLTAWQQTILFIQMCLGTPVVVSWVVVYVRKYYFAKQFKHVIVAMKAERAARAAKDTERGPPRWPERVATFLHSRKATYSREEGTSDGKRAKRRRGSILRNLRPDMIRRLDSAPKPVNPSGWVNEDAVGVTPDTRPPLPPPPPLRLSREGNRTLSFVESPKETQGRTFRRTATEQTSSPKATLEKRSPQRRLSDPGVSSRPSSPEPQFPKPANVADAPSHTHTDFPRTQTIEWAPSVSRRRDRRSTLHPLQDDSVTEAPSEDYRSARRSSIAATHATTRTHISLQDPRHRGFGGFPMPSTIISYFLDRFFPTFKRRIQRTITMPLTTSLVSQGGAAPTAGAKVVPYITFDAIVGRNSSFNELTSEQLDELGGVEYRALNALLWIVAIYYLACQLVPFAVIAPYMSTSRWQDNFVPPAQVRPLVPAWFSLFQVVSAFTNTGSSLVDQSVVPFQTAYPMVFFMMFLILAGNTCFPIFLRFAIWALSKCVGQNSRLNETLHFLLDHPRRCFMYLFPSHQTWFLLFVVVLLNSLDWFFFMVLDIGNAVIESIPLGNRFSSGLLQCIAVRAAGFTVVPLAAVSPAVKVLFVVMMYISVFPIAMSVRSTNVYEERSLGIYPAEDPSPDDAYNSESARRTVWSKYLAMHMRKQLAFDMWWLVIALFLICIIERGMLDDPQNYGWFNVFTIIFELVSAYGTVGLSLGIPDQNYSLSGTFKPLSKLIVCAVIIRGRHRGLPVAIDRAVVLPWSEERRMLDATSEFSRHPSIVTTSQQTQHNAVLPDNKSNLFFDVRQSPLEMQPGDLPVDAHPNDDAN